MKNLFDTEDEIKQAISAFTNLQNHPGWKLFEAILDENIEVLKDQLETGGEEETLEDMRIIRNNLRTTREHRDTPKNMVKKLQSPEPEEPNPDPYPTADELRKERGEVNKD